jgi:hypothetical protein
MLTHADSLAEVVCLQLLSHARTSLTRQPVIRADNLIGLGNFPALTIRHKVGALNGKGAG